MAHLVGKDIYRALGEKLDSLTCKTPWTPEFEALLKKLYTAEEAAIVCQMPFGLSSPSRVSQILGRPVDDELATLAEKGLLMDVELAGVVHYMPSPFVIGVFEFTMMRTRGAVEPGEWARLFKGYLDTGELYRANAHDRIAVPPMRTLPHEESLPPGVCEVLDFEKASAMVLGNDTFALGICSCRHEKHHLGEACDVPLDTCASMGSAAQYMIRHGFGEEISREAMLDHLVASRDRGLVLTTENVARGANYLCSCCGCCCNLMKGITTHGYTNTVLTSRYIARPNPDSCTSCGLCVKKCPVDALSLDHEGQLHVDERVCLGCGVCVLACPVSGVTMEPRAQAVISPETIFERILLMALERGNLQYQIFDNPSNPIHRVMHSLLGGFLRLHPVQSNLAHKLLGSRFLGNVRKIYEKFYGLDFSNM